MKAIKIMLSENCPGFYKFLFNIKEMLYKANQSFKHYRSIKKFKTNHLIKNYQFNKKLAQRVAMLGCMEELCSALKPPPKTLNAGCDQKLIVMLVVSALRIDPRVEREARALAANGYQIIIICPDISMPRLREQPLDWGKNIKFDILDTEAAMYVNEHPWLQGKLLLQAALAYKPMAFHCHDLSTALIGLAAARQIGCKCVCDFHEWYSENVSWRQRNAKIHPWKKAPAEIVAATCELLNQIITLTD